MAQNPMSGTDWTPEENDVIVVDYFAMLTDELAGKPYVKSHHNAVIVQRTGRSHGSVERKYMESMTKCGALTQLHAE